LILDFTPIAEIWIFIAGLFAGLFIAVSGALKDIRWEKFSWKKFWRTPLFSTTWAFLLILMFEFDEWIILMLASGAMERITTEIYKLQRRKKPDKFKSPDRDTEWFLMPPKESPWSPKEEEENDKQK